MSRLWWWCLHGAIVILSHTIRGHSHLNLVSAVFNVASISAYNFLSAIFLDVILVWAPALVCHTGHWCTLGEVARSREIGLEALVVGLVFMVVLASEDAAHGKATKQAIEFGIHGLDFHGHINSLELPSCAVLEIGHSVVTFLYRPG